MIDPLKDDLDELTSNSRAQGSEPGMSESPFDFTSKPFSSVPDAECFVPLEIHREALAALHEWADSAEGVGMLTGAPGLGKTLVCHRLMANLNDEMTVILLPHGSFPNVLSFLKALLFQMNCNYAGLDEDELRLELGGALQDIAGQNGRLLLIIDGAHEMSESMLQEIQMMVATGENNASGMMILLSGQLELEELLTRRSLSGLNQRLRSHQILESLTRAESADYLAGRIEWAGSDIEAVMSEEAVELMTHLSDGVPRCLNRIAETSLRVASNRHLEIVDRDCVREAFEDVRHLPLHWNALPDESPGLDASSSEHEVPDLSDRVSEAIVEAQGPKSMVPDLRSEAEEAGVEYAVAEFGGEEDDTEQSAESVRDVTKERDSEQSVVEFSKNSGQYEETDDARHSESSNPLLAEVDLHSEWEELVDIMETSKTEEPAAEPADDSSSRDLRTDEASSKYLQSRLNPVDIFAVDLPTEDSHSENGAFESAASNGAVATAVQPDAQQLIADEVQKVVEQESEAGREESSVNQAQQYDVIEPEAIPDISKVRPTFELDLPHREPQPRYRNLFRDLRRRRG